jgi:hypothetical protein
MAAMNSAGLIIELGDRLVGVFRSRAEVCVVG